MDICLRLPGWIDEIARPGAVCEGDEAKMEIAVALARRNVEEGGGPFGALVLHRPTGRVVAGGVNMVLAANLSAFHGEMTAIAAAQTRLGSYTLDVNGGHELFTSSEPCAMCLGGILWSGVKRVVFGASCESARAIGFDEGPVFPETWQYLRDAGIEVAGGVLAGRSREVLELYVRRGGVIYNP